MAGNIYSFFLLFSLSILLVFSLSVFITAASSSHSSLLLSSVFELYFVILLVCKAVVRIFMYYVCESGYARLIVIITTAHCSSM